MRVVRITLTKTDDERIVVLTDEEFRDLRYLLSTIHDGQWVAEEIKTIDNADAREWVKSA